MIKFEHTETFGWESAIRGMRNPLNSWNKSDSYISEFTEDGKGGFVIGESDMLLMEYLREAGTDHRKFLRMIDVRVDITAPLYWWKEFDTYKVGTVANSCSTMHKIQAKEFTLDDFSHEHLTSTGFEVMEDVLEMLNDWRDYYINWDEIGKHVTPEIKSKKDVWWQMIQLLPSSYNQKRTVMLNYEVLNNIYKSRKSHKLDEWRVGFMEWINSLPYAKELITGEE